MTLPEQKIHLLQIITTYWPIGACSLIVSLLATPTCRIIALRVGAVDKPDQWLKPHGKPIPYLGGVAIFLGWATGILVAMKLYAHSDIASVTTHQEPTIFPRMMMGILLAGTIIMLIGLWDDLRPLPPKAKLAGNIGVACLLVYFSLGDDIIYLLAHPSRLILSPWMVLIYSLPITIFVVVVACNATNLIDGVDGLCSGVFAVISTGFLVLAVHMHLWSDWHPLDAQRVTLALALLGAALGFLPFNRNPAKIFMGDAGSMLLGLNAAILLLLFAKQTSVRWALGSLMVFGLPIADMLLTLSRRWRNQRPLMQGDRSHFYDQLLDRGMPVKKVVAISYGLAGLFAVVGCSAILLRVRYIIPFYVLIIAATVYAIKKSRMVQIQPPPKKRANRSRTLHLLFTSAGRRVSLINSFRQAAEAIDVELVVHAADNHPMAPALHVSDESLLVPRAGSDTYCETLLEYCRLNRIDGLIPLIDPELPPLSANVARFQEIGTRVLVSSPDVVRTSVDKVLTNSFLLDHGFLTPRILGAQELPSPCFPIFIKPRVGSSSVGAYRIDTADDLEYLLRKHPDSIVQEFIPGVEYTIDVFADLNGQPRCAVPRLRHEVRGGEVSKGQAIKHKRIMAESIRLVKELKGCVGVITIQCFLTPDDRIVFIEINPRFGGGAPLSIQAKADAPRWIMEILLGQEPVIDADGWTDNLLMLRYDEAVYIDGEQVGRLKGLGSAVRA